MAFWDALCLRYNWTPHHLPRECVYGTTFSTEHALSCPSGRVAVCQHNEVHDQMADVLTDVYNDINVEPCLQPLSGETFTTHSTATEDHSRLDIAASGFWGGKFEKAFFVRSTHTLNPQCAFK